MFGTPPVDELESAQQALGRQPLALTFSNTAFEYRRTAGNGVQIQRFKDDTGLLLLVEATITV